MIFPEKLKSPTQCVDVVLDTDAYNEIDDQFAIAYLLRSKERANTVAIYAAPFYNDRCNSPADGMQKSYEEILKVLDLCGVSQLRNCVYPGSENYLPDENTPVISEAAQDLAKRAMQYTQDSPLYVIAIGAITNIASALLIEPRIRDRIVVIWLGGHAHHWCDTAEFNMRQDYPAARVVMGSGVPFVQLPCNGVVSELRTTIPELQHWLVGKNPLADYLARNTIAYGTHHNVDMLWSKVIWDVTAVAWLFNDEDKLLRTRITNIRLPNLNGQYEEPIDIPMCYVYGLYRDRIFRDLFLKLL